MDCSHCFDTDTDAPALETGGRVLVHGVRLYDAVEWFLTLGRARRWARRCIDLLGLRGDERVLDIGCGTGLLTLETACRVLRGQVVGVDASNRMLEVARRRRSRPNILYRAAVAERLPFDDASFDAACSSFFFHHIAADLKKRALSEATRVLRCGAPLVIFDMAEPYHSVGWLVSWLSWKVLRQPEIRENMLGMVPRLLEESGFSGVREGFRASGFLRAYVARKAHRT